SRRLLQPAIPDSGGRRVVRPERQPPRRRQPCGARRGAGTRPHRFPRGRGGPAGQTRTPLRAISSARPSPAPPHPGRRSRRRRRRMRGWLAGAGGDPIVALAGKLAPLFGIFFVTMLSVPLILEGMFEIPFKGNVPMIVAAGSLLIIAYLALGALLQLLLRDLP